MGARLVTFLLACGCAVAAAQTQTPAPSAAAPPSSNQAPSEPPSPDTPAATFKTGVAVVTVDVAVTDERGRAVRDLLAPDFQVKVDGKLRRVVTAQHVAFDVAAMTRDSNAQKQDETFFSTNIGPPQGRMILVAVDQSNIRPGAVRQLLRTAAAFVDRLAPTDQVAFVAYPPPGPEVGFTTDRLRVKQAMEQVVGNQQQFQGKFNIGIYEAIGIYERSDATMTKVVVDRECSGVSGRALEIQECSREVMNEAAELTQHVRSEGTIAVQALQSLLRRLAIIDGQKSVVLLSEGLLLDEVGSEVEDVARLAAMARASMHVLLMDVSRADVTQAVMPPSPTQDRALQMKGLEDIAAMSRGSLFQVLGTGQSAFDRLASELSGYYVLGVEEAPTDRDGKKHRMDVQVRRKGLTLRSHRAFVVSSAAASKPPAERLLEALQSPFAVAEVPVRVANHAFQDPENGAKVRVLVSAEVGQSGTTAEEFTVGYVLFDASDGRVVASGSEKRRLGPIDGRADTPLGYTFATTVDPGIYTLRFGVVDKSGRRGSVVRDVRAWKTANEPFAVGDLLVGDVTSKDMPIPPAVEPHVRQNSIGGYAELYASDTKNFNGISLTFDVAEDQDGPALASAPAEFFKGPRHTTVVAQALIPLDRLPPGRYVTRARIERDGTLTGVLLRPFILDASGERSTIPVGMDHLLAWVPKFDKDALLKPDLLRTLLGLADSGPALKGAMAEAQAGRYGAAALEALTAGDQRAAAFLKGLDFYSKGQLDQAATQFNTATGPRRDYFPATFFLGACFAAAGRDQDAAGIWQMGMRSEPRPIPALMLLADARLRAGHASSVIDVLAPVAKQPGDDGVLKRLGLAYVLTSRFAEALPFLDEFLGRHATDQEALFAMVLSQYEVGTKSGVALSEAQRTKLRRFVTAYKGPQQALLSRYLTALTPK